MQSTNEVPQGPLTLRVYPGNDCAGHLYLDDGKSYAYLNGASLRMDFHCEMTANGLRVKIGKHEGSYRAWWQQIHVEVYGLSNTKKTAYLDATMLSDSTVTDHPFSVTIPDNGAGSTLDLKW